MERLREQLEKCELTIHVSYSDGLQPLSEMHRRYISRQDDNGLFSIVDSSTGQRAAYAGRELTRIPEEMLQNGLRIMNELDRAELNLLTMSALGAAMN